MLQGGRLTREWGRRAGTRGGGGDVWKQVMTGGAQKVDPRVGRLVGVDPRVPSSHARQGSPSHYVGGLRAVVPVIDKFA